jgi:hypothetical protein
MQEFILRETVVHGLSTWHYVEGAVATLCLDRGFDSGSFINAEVANMIAQHEESWATQDHVSTVWKFAQSRMG